MKLSAEQIAEIVNGSIEGNKDALVDTVAKIEDATPNSLCFLSNKKYTHHLKDTKAGIVLVDESIINLPEQLTIIRCSHPYVAFCQILIQYFDYNDPHHGIHPTAIIESSAKIGQNCHIGSHAYIGNNVVIGNNSKVFANSSIYEDSKIGQNTSIRSNVSIYYNTQIGDNCIIHSGAVIGSDGFGHAPLPDGTYIKIPQIGNVIINDNVEIGSNTSVDRANMGSTIIGKGCRIDNLVQIAHGVEIGDNTVIAGQSAVAGSTKIGANCVLAGQVGVGGHLTIADNTQFGGQAGVNKDIKKPGGVYTGTPHNAFKEEMKSRVLWRNLPEIEQRLRTLENKLNNNAKSKNG